MTTTTVEYRFAGLELRAAAEGDEGTFEGLACAAGVRDAYGTTFAPGCWTAGGLDGDVYALLDMHDPTVAIGTFRAREAEDGLWIAGAWDDTAAGRDARVRARSGSAPGLSVGFTPVMVDPDDPDVFTQTRLIEVSQITARMAAVPGSEFTASRAGVIGRREKHRARQSRLAAARARLTLAG